LKIIVISNIVRITLGAVTQNDNKYFAKDNICMKDNRIFTPSYLRE